MLTMGQNSVRAILDSNRNSLMLLDLKFSIGTLGLGAGTFFAALYGMNLKNFIEESDLGFWGVSALCTVSSIALIVWGLKKLRSVQRVSMWGGAGEMLLPVRGGQGEEVACRGEGGGGVGAGGGRRGIGGAGRAGGGSGGR